MIWRNWSSSPKGGAFKYKGEKPCKEASSIGTRHWEIIGGGGWVRVLTPTS
jgi:hypothetical protein